jgi:PAS domain-containing protein
MSAPPSPSREELLRENAELRTRLAQAEEGQQLLEALLQHVPEGITIAKGPDLRVCLISRHGRQLLGGGEADPASGETGAQWLVFQAGQESPLGDDELPLARAIRSGETVRDQELVRIDPQGRRLWLLCSAAPIRDGEGHIVAGIEVWSDITARKAAGEDLARQRAELQAIFDALPASVFVKDRSNRFLRANQVFADSLGLPRAQIENRSAFDLFPAEQATTF